MDYTTNSIKSLTTINSPNGVANTWSIGIASLFGLVVLFVAGACVGVYVVSRCRTSLKKQKLRSMYEKLTDHLDNMEDGYCRLKGNKKKHFIISHLSILTLLNCVNH